MQERLPTMLDAIAAERPYLMRLASRRLRNAEQSEDAVQSALAAAVASASRFAGKSSVRTWLTAILGNAMVDANRIRRREPLLGDLPAKPAPQTSDSSASCDPSEILQADELAVALWQALETMPSASAQAFVMRELEGHPTKHILRRLNLSPAQYWQRLHRARTAMRSLARRHGRNEPPSSGGSQC